MRIFSSLIPATVRRCLLPLLLVLWRGAAGANMGLAEIPAQGSMGVVTVFYPTSSPEQPVRRGLFTLALAVDGVPARGNGRLIVISHGSGGSPWVHTNLARSLVDAGFMVAMPAHSGDNYLDDGHPGPVSWTLRPLEVSRAIDEVGKDTRFAPLLELDKVGMYGMSAGGHTALSLAGGSWSPALFKQHCEQDLAQDFQSCVGLATRLTGGMLDGLKKWLALQVIRHRFDDPTLRSHTDKRIAAIVAGVPASADFDMDTLKTPVVPLALITARKDRWLVPRFHSDRVLAACLSCIHLADLPDAGHGALLSPLPPGLHGLVGDLLNDPPGFDRSQMAEVDKAITGFFRLHLLN